jgi:hypothetical protein
MIFLSKEPSPKINKFTIYGERHSGTNFLESTVEKVYKISPTWQYGWKHFPGFCNIEKLKTSSETLFLTITRNPYDWIMAMYKMPHHVPIENQANIYSMMSNEWISLHNKNQQEVMEDRNYMNNERYTNIFEMRCCKLDYLINILPNYISNYIIITYEDFLNNQDMILNLISTHFRLPISDIAPTVIVKKPYVLDPSVEKIINENINWKLENIYGYYKNKII